MMAFDPLTRQRLRFWQVVFLAFFPQNIAGIQRGIQIAFYQKGERGMFGQTVNVILRSLGVLGLILNVVLVPFGFLSSVLFFPLALLMQPFRLVLPASTFLRIADIAAFPGQALIWGVYAPVKLCNLILGIIALYFGPKSSF